MLSEDVDILVGWMGRREGAWKMLRREDGGGRAGRRISILEGINESRGVKEGSCAVGVVRFPGWKRSVMELVGGVLLCLGRLERSWKLGPRPRGLEL